MYLVQVQRQWSERNSVLPELFDERKLNTIFGGMSDHGAAAYILFYEKVDKNRKFNKEILAKYQMSEGSTNVSPAKQKK